MTEAEPRPARTRDAAAARAAILDAAEATFAAHGFAGARTQAIAALSGYNTSLIFHYFRDKLGLYAAVIQRADAELSVVLRRMLASAAPAVERGAPIRPMLEQGVGAMFDYLVEHPHFCRLLLWEQAQGWQTLTRIAALFPVEEHDPLVAMFGSAYRAGWLRTDFHPIVQLTLMLQVCLAYLGALPAYALALAPGTDLSSPTALADARAFVVSFVANGMLREGATPRP